MAIDRTAVMMLLALQLAALGWRVAREIDGRERHPFPWVPLPDNVNIAAMLAVVLLCVIAPMTAIGMRLYSVNVLSRAVFAAACVLIAAHPLVVACHYRLWGGSRSTGVDKPALPYCGRSEALVQLVALIGAGAVFVWVLQAANQPGILLPTG